MTMTTNDTYERRSYGLWQKPRSGGGVGEGGGGGRGGGGGGGKGL
ncbi:hypothetical protein [Nocardia brasiliensis]|nr:hypothetical protein [Nocardia brasiliensis]